MSHLLQVTQTDREGGRVAMKVQAQIIQLAQFSRHVDRTCPRLATVRRSDLDIVLTFTPRSGWSELPPFGDSRGSTFTSS